MLDGATPFQHRWPDPGIKPGCRANIAGRTPGDRFGPFWGIGLDPLRQLFVAMAPLVNELSVFETFLDDYVEHGESQRIVGARAQLQPYIGPPGEHGFSWIDDDDFWLAGESLPHAKAQFAVGARIDGIVAPEQDQVRKNIIGISAYG